jgi:hypothetical protein
MAIEIASTMRNIMSGNLYRLAQIKPKFDNPISNNITSLTSTISQLNSVKSIITDSLASSCLQKIVSYLSWYKTVGFGGETSILGKDNMLPNIPELVALVRTGLFGKRFISSLLAILKLNDYATNVLTKIP